MVNDFALCGFIAGEGCFYRSRSGRAWPDGDAVTDFGFKVTVASHDRTLLEHLRRRLGYGSIFDTPPRRRNWLPTSTFMIHSLRAHRIATIPFMDRFLIAGAKRQQYVSWKRDLIDYIGRHAIRAGGPPIRCSVEGCERPIRGRRLCRGHYYRATGW